MKRETAAAAAAYLVLTIALTWPLSLGLTHDVASDLGDPLLNTWILAWNATHLGPGWWNANIYAPHPLTLAYSEHLFAQSLQILPVYALTKNPILCYNLVFLSTFLLSGLGMFLLARELTGHSGAAFVAGLAFAFPPYRMSVLSHLQVQSSAWMPFALYGWRRYFVAERTRALVGGAAAWLAETLSCAYYMVYFTPVVLLYLAWEITTRRLWTNRRMLIAIGIACIAVLAATAAFIPPYLEVRRQGFGARPVGVVASFSADVYSYFTATPNLRVWGSIARAWTKPEGSLFPGVTIAALAALALIAGPGTPARAVGAARRARWERALLLLVTAALAATAALLLGFAVRLPPLKITSLSRTLTTAGAGLAVLLIASAHARETARRWARSPIGFFFGMTVFAIVMSFGPDVEARGRVVASTNLFEWFYRFVPGFDALRTVALFEMLVVLGLATLAAYGAVVLARKGTWTLVVAGALIVVEAIAVPVPMNQSNADYKRPHLARLPDQVSTTDFGDLYAFVASLPPSATIAELPLGEPPFDVRYMLYSTRHWRRLVNGYSGRAPVDYEQLDQRLQDVLERPDRAWQALKDTPATHVIVHEAFYEPGRGAAVSEWLRGNGAKLIASIGSDRVFEVGHRF